MRFPRLFPAGALYRAIGIVDCIARGSKMLTPALRFSQIFAWLPKCVTVPFSRFSAPIFFQKKTLLIKNMRIHNIC